RLGRRTDGGGRLLGGRARLSPLPADRPPRHGLAGGLAARDAGHVRAPGRRLRVRRRRGQAAQPGARGSRGAGGRRDGPPARDLARSGVAGAGPPLGTPRTAWQSAAVDGDVYGSPLVVDGRVIVVTQHNTAYAFDARTGNPDWQVSLGTPVQGSTLPCGNVKP